MKARVLTLFCLVFLSTVYAQEFRMTRYLYTADLPQTIDGKRGRVIQFTSGKKLGTATEVRSCVNAFLKKHPNEIIECYAFRSTRIMDAKEVKYKNAANCWYLRGRGSRDTAITIQKNPILNTRACFSNDR